MDVHTWTVSPLAERNTSAHQGLVCPSSPVTLQTEQLHAAHWHLSLSLALSMCTGTRRMKLQPWRAFKSGTGPSQLAIVVDYFWLVTTVCTSLHQSAPVCTSLHHACRRFARPGEQLARPCPHVEIVC
jgi:hypothetical protein